MNWHFNVQDWMCMSVVLFSEIPRSAHLLKQISAKPIQSSQTPGLMACASGKLRLPDWFSCKLMCFCNSFSGSANRCIPLYWLLCPWYVECQFLIVRQTRCTSFFSLCERFWSFRAKSMRSPCHLGRSKLLADSPRHLQPLVAAGPWKCLKSFNFGQHKCDQQYCYCMYWRTSCTNDCRYCLITILYLLLQYIYIYIVIIYHYTSHINLSGVYFSHTHYYTAIHLSLNCHPKALCW